MKKNLIQLFVSLIVVLSFSAGVFSQTTEFTYQGSLQNGGTPATGSYDFQFLLFDALTGGTQNGTTLSKDSVSVANGTFSVKLDFGGQFPGANRFLEIHVRQSGGGAYTPLTPRQPVNSAPYAVTSLNTTQLGGVAAGQYVLTTDPRMTDTRSPTAGSPNYIQNGVSLQATSNFNVSGNGTAGGTLTGHTVDSGSQYNLFGFRVLSIPGSNLFVGRDAGAANSSGFDNTFAGFGAGAGNTTGADNSFFGQTAGVNNTSGASNTFAGSEAGYSNNQGQHNSFFGAFAGLANVTGSYNTTIGDSADVGAGNLVNATAIGAGAIVSTSNSLVLGNSANVGIGTSSPQYALHVVGQNVRVEGDALPRFSLNYTAGGNDQKRWQNYAGANTLNFTALNDAENAETFWLQVTRGTGTTISSVIFPTGNVVINNLGAPGIAHLCRNASNQISTCAASAPEPDSVTALQQRQIEAQQKQIEEQHKQIESLRAVVCAIRPEATVCSK